MYININMTIPEAEATLKVYQESEKVAVDWLTQIRSNIQALEAALRPVMKQVVRSSTDPNYFYTVKRYPALDGYRYECNCASYKYANGLDADGNCKHVRMAVENQKGWWA